MKKEDLDSVKEILADIIFTGCDLDEPLEDGAVIDEIVTRFDIENMRSKYAKINRKNLHH